LHNHSADIDPYNDTYFIKRKLKKSVFQFNNIYERDIEYLWKENSHSIDVISQVIKKDNNKAIKYFKIFLDNIKYGEECFHTIYTTIGKLFKINRVLNDDDLYMYIIDFCRKFEMDDAEEIVIEHIKQNITISRMRKFVKYFCYNDKYKLSENKNKIIKFLIKSENSKFYKRIGFELGDKNISNTIFSFI
jgi:hypothetical protein